MATIYAPEALNIFVTNQGPDNSKHLVITETTLPKLQEKTFEHHAGGSIGSIEIGGLGIQPLTLGFKLSGYDPQTLAQFGLGGTGQLPFTVYGAVRDKQSGTAKALKVMALGRLTQVEHGNWKRGEGVEQTHEIKEITMYSMTWDGSELYYYDFYNSIWRVNGVNQVSDIQTILQINTN